MNEIRITARGLQVGRPTTRPNMPAVRSEEIFTSEFSHEDPYRHKSLTREAALFLRWAMVIDTDRREEFWAFARRFSQSRPSNPEEVLLSHLGMSYGQIAVELSDPHLHRAQVAESGNTSQMQLSEVRQANEEEVARLIDTIEGLNERTTAHNTDMMAAR
jgi:hypothetical protein